MLAYQVCECTRSAPSQSAAMRQVDAEGLQGGVRAGASSGRSAYAGGAGLVARLAEAADPHVEVAALAQRPDQLGDVHTRSSVDRRGVLLAEDVDSHDSSP